MAASGNHYGYLEKTGAVPVTTCKVTAKAIAVSGSSRGQGALGSAPESKTGMAGRAKIQGNESPMYEKLEKRSLTALKAGGSEKELRAGHNFSAMDAATGGLSGLFGGGDSGPSAAELRRQKRTKQVHQVAKSGVNVNASTNPVLAARVARRREVSAAKASGVKGAAKTARQQASADVRLAKEKRASFTSEQKTAAKAGRAATMMQARTVNKGNRQVARANKAKQWAR